MISGGGSPRADRQTKAQAPRAARPKPRDPPPQVHDPSQSPPIPGTAPVDRLVRALGHAQGFALFFARCNVVAFRSQVVEQLKAAVGRPIIDVSLPARADPYPALAVAATTAPAEAVLFVYGLEQLLPSGDRARSRRSLSAMNWRRQAYRRLQRPLVFWVPEYALPLIAEGAPDLFDWNSGIFDFVIPQQVRVLMLAEALNEDDLALASLSAGAKSDRVALLADLWNEYQMEGTAAQRARLRLASQLGVLERLRGNHLAARAWGEKAMDLARALGDRAGEAATCHGLASIDLYQGHYDAAREGFQRALAVRQEIGDRAGEAATWHNLASIDLCQGHYDLAREGFQRALAMRQEIGDQAGEATTWHNLAIIDVHEGQHEAARAVFQRSLAIEQEVGNRAGEAATWAQLGLLAAEEGRREAGVRLLALAAGLLQPLGYADLERVKAWVNALAWELQYTQEQLDAMFREVAEAYERDRGSGLLRAAFPEEGMEPAP